MLPSHGSTCSKVQAYSNRRFRFELRAFKMAWLGCRRFRQIDFVSSSPPGEQRGRSDLRWEHTRVQDNVSVGIAQNMAVFGPGEKPRKNKSGLVVGASKPGPVAA